VNSGTDVIAGVKVRENCWAVQANLIQCSYHAHLVLLQAELLENEAPVPAKQGAVEVHVNDWSQATSSANQHQRSTDAAVLGSVVQRYAPACCLCCSTKATPSLCVQMLN
jgi:hypothetical protein